MDSKPKWPSCRLVVNTETGRIKWCVGSEKTWKIRLKYLALLPLIVLPITLLCIFLSQSNVRSDKDQLVNKSTVSSYYVEKEIIRAEERDILRDVVQTAFIPQETITPTYPNIDTIKVKRQTDNNENIPKTSLNARVWNGPKRKKDSAEWKLLNNDLKKTLCQNASSDNSSECSKENCLCDTKEDKQAKLINPIQDLIKNMKQSAESKILHRSKRLNPNKYQNSKKQESNILFNETNIVSNDLLVFANTSENNSATDNKYSSMFQHVNVRNKSTIEMIRTAQAHLMLRYMDTTVDPCQDFYQYSCGNWDKYNPIPLDKSAYDTFEVLRERLDYVLKNLLEEEVSNHDEEPNKDMNETSNTEDTTDNIKNDALSKAKRFYKSCNVQQRGHKPLLDLLEKLGGWPMIHPHWNSTDFDWLMLVAKLRLYNNDILISEWVGSDIQNSKEYIVQLDQTTLGLPSRDYYLDPVNKHYLEAYKSFMISVTSLLGATKNSSKADVDDIINFEIDLAKIITPSEKRRNVTDLYQRLTFKELQLLIPQITWKKYLTTVLNREVTDNLQIVCYAMEYMQRLTELIKVTPPRTLANYLLWRFVRHRINNLDDLFLTSKEKFYLILYGREKSPPRWQNCVTQVNSNMGMAVGSLFVQKYFDEFSKNDTLFMTTEIQKSFRDIISQISWLNSDTRKLARMKVDAMKLRIGYPDFILNITELSERYSDIVIQPDTYFENTLSVLQHLTRTEQARLNHSVDKRKWYTAPAVVNAYYSRNKNEIIFPAGILQPPFYHQHFPRALNFGGIGVVIGHEITHGFDDKGRLFDKEGNLQRWWNDRDIFEFQSRAKCLIDQYNKYNITEIGVQVDGTNTQGENIADNGGIKQAYRAYQRWRKLNMQVDETMPGLNMSENKLFFLNFAQVWCGAMRPEATRNKMKTAVHSPGRYRVIGTLSNFPEFINEFNCRVGTQMNSDTKCNLW
ncbi:Neprilysin 4 [Carabus blaptoides fortunei]